MATFSGLSDLLRSGAPEGEEPPDVPDDLSEIADEQGDPADVPDPQPARRSGRRGRRSASMRAAGKPSRAEQTQVKDALTMLYTLPAWGVRVRDPHCGGALMDQRDDIVNALVPIVCRNPTMLGWFTGPDARWLDLLALANALAPVGKTIWSHHVTRTVGHEAEAEGGGVNGFDLSNYSAPAFG